MPSYKDVPEAWKAPMGPYRQAPPEHGGEWWLVNPFNPRPWLKPKPKETLPEGFEELFGPRPEWKNFRAIGATYRQFQVAVVEWEQELRFFKGAGRPEWVTRVQLEDVATVYRDWNLGQPTFYETNTGWMARFLDSQIRDFDVAAHQAVRYPHHTVAHYQVDLFLNHGITPEKWHPYVPPAVFLEGDAARREIERRMKEASKKTRKARA